MARLDIDAILNTPEEVIINGKTFYIKEFTIKERLEFIDIIYTQTQMALKKIKDNPEQVLAELQSKDVSDYQLLLYVFKKFNPHIKFTEKEFDALTKTQIQSITNLIFKKNDLFQPGKKEVVTE